MRKHLLPVLGAMLLTGMSSSLWAQPCTAPSNVTASPSSICPGSTAQLNATSTGNTIYWYTVPVGGVAIGNSASGVNFPVSPGSTTTYYAEAVGSSNGSQTFNYTGAVQTFTVPSGVTSINIDARGAQGGGSFNGAGGMGARMVGTFSVTPGQVLSVVVGQQGLLQQGGNAQNSSGGGGGTFVYGTGPTLLVAAGGGGGKCNYTSSGPLHGGAAGQVTTGGGASSDGNPGGTGGNGGPAGLWSGTPCAGGGAGWLSAGGGPYGGASYSTWTGGAGFCGGGGGGCGGVGGFGGGGGGGNHYGGGGGGGGYSGGGGGTDPTHGGGGGSFSSGTSQSNTPGFQTGNGQVLITWSGTGCTASARTAVTLTVATLGNATNVTATPSVICPGGTSDLNATSPGTGISWYTALTGGVLVGSSLSGANFPVTPSSTTTYYAEATDGSSSGSQTFNYTGAVQSFTVPSGVTSINIDARGAQGGGSFNGAGGMGARMVGDYTVTPGQVLSIAVGQQGLLQQGGNAQNSSGGGGGTFVYAAGPSLLVAAGGGGGKCNYTSSGPLHGGAAGQVTTGGGASSDGNPGGTGGNGGPAGLWSGTPCAGGGAGWLSAGGGPYGGASYSTWTGGPGFCGGGGGGCGGVGGFGGGGGGGNHYGGGGGGGGYSGGGGGTDPTHGGGGGSFSSGTNQSNTPGFQTGNGQVIITWTGVGCVAATRIPVTVTVDNVAPVANCQAVTLTLDNNGNATLTTNDVDNGSSDNCSISSASLSQTAFTCANAGSNTVTLTVTDGNGNTGTCSANVTVMSSTLSSTIDTVQTVCGYNITCNGGSDGIATASGVLGCTGYTYLWSNGSTSPVNSGLVAGTYTVTVTDASGSTSVSTTTLTEPSVVIPNEVTTPSCVGQTSGAIDLSTTGGNSCQGGYTYLWNTGATTEDLSNLAPGTYTVTITDAAGCTSVHTITVGSLPSPAPAFTQSGNTLTSSQTWFTYQWQLNGNNISGATNSSYVATQSGSYTLVVTDTNGCIGTSTPLQVTVVGITDQMGEWAGMKLWPNPARGECRISTPQPIGDRVTLRITDLQGKLLQVRELEGIEHEVALDIRNLAAGTYLVELSSVAGQHRLFRLAVQ